VLLQKEDIDPYGYSVVSFDFDKKKDADYETIKSLRDGNLVVDRSGDSSAMSRGPRAQPNVYSSLSRAKPVARPAMAVVSDLNSDYAEILSPPAATSDIWNPWRRESDFVHLLHGDTSKQWRFW
jgi:hypothetical protein